MIMNLIPTRQGGKAFKEGNPKDLTFLQLRDYIRRISSANERTTRYRFEFHRRLAYPWNCFGLALAGLVVAIRRGGRHIAMDMAIGMLVASGFYTFQTFLDTLATKDMLNPLISGWTPPLLLSIVCMKMLGRAGQQ